MDKQSLLPLKNGSDIRGVALAEPGGQPVTLIIIAFRHA